MAKALFQLFVLLALHDVFLIAVAIQLHCRKVYWPERISTREGGNCLKDFIKKCGITPKGRPAIPKTTGDLYTIREAIKHDMAFVGAQLDAKSGKYLWLDGTDLADDHMWWEAGQPQAGTRNPCVVLKEAPEGNLSDVRIYTQRSSLFGICEACVGKVNGTIPNCYTQGGKLMTSENSIGGCFFLTTGRFCADLQYCPESKSHCDTSLPCGTEFSLCSSGMAQTYEALECREQSCPRGMHGDYCHLHCHCKEISETVCSTRNGSCYSDCADGWLGSFCNETECSKGLWGDECQHLCACSYRRQCEPITGQCPEGCLIGWLGQGCNETGCTIGSFGEMCKENCSCGDGVPCGLDGRCPDEVFVERRDDCINTGRWGYQCEKKCKSKGCVRCDRDTGKICRKCGKKFTQKGNKCIQKPSDSTLLKPITIAVGVGVAAASAAVGVAAYTMCSTESCGKIGQGVCAGEMYNCCKKKCRLGCLGKGENKKTGVKTGRGKKNVRFQVNVDDKEGDKIEEAQGNNQAQDNTSSTEDSSTNPEPNISTAGNSVIRK